MPDKWLTKIAPWVFEEALADGVPARHVHQMIQVFKSLGDDPHPTAHAQMCPVACVAGRLWRQKTRKPVYLYRYRNMIAVVRYDEWKREKTHSAGALILVGVFQRDERTYTPERLKALIDRLMKKKA